MTSCQSGRRVRLCTLIVTVVLISISIVFLSSKRSVSGPKCGPLDPLVGAHYYLWFPENWKHGYSGRKFLPPVNPALGEYSTADLSVFEKHWSLAQASGVDFFIFDWWPNRPQLDVRLQKITALGSQYPHFRFSLHYESLDLKTKGDPPINGESENVVYMTPERAERLKQDWLALAKRYMDSPQYLRINNRPVLFVYATRHLVGPVAAAIKGATNFIAEVTGEQLFLIADEAYFNVVSYKPERGIYLLAEHEIDEQRAMIFDGITSYNPYDPAKSDHAGSAGAARFLGDVAEFYHRYQEFSLAHGKLFVPTVIPGYNDRGVRPKANHFVIPRVIREPRVAAGSRSFFSESLNRWVLPFIDCTTPVFVITSWNEWNEGTQIEPAAESSATSTDSSRRPGSYTLGEEYDGYGHRLLNELREYLDQLVAE